MTTSDGSTASYYELPAGCTELQDLISYRNLNAQDGEIFRAIYRKGRASHSDELRDARKVLFYAKAEVKRLEAKMDNRHEATLNYLEFRQRQTPTTNAGPMLHCPDCTAEHCPCVAR